MLDAAKPHLLRVLGPGSVGLQSPALGLNASFTHLAASAGKLAFVSQSGALATAVLDWAGLRGIGFSRVVAMGDTADVDFGDLLDYLAADSETEAILLCIENLSSARKFMSAGRLAARGKPVIVLKVGRDAAPGADLSVRRRHPPRRHAARVFHRRPVRRGGNAGAAPAAARRTAGGADQWRRPWPDRRRCAGMQRRPTGALVGRDT
jgi:succinyl-CoA synthetase alpha subunit